MSNPRGWTPTLRYSPVNGMIVDWGVNGLPFALCGLPAPVEAAPPPAASQAPAQACKPIAEPVDTYDWFRWVPETIAGLRDANEDMAASYARRAAITFATEARVLRRHVAVELQPGTLRYPIDVFEDERAVGVARIECAQGPCQSEGQQTGMFIGHAKVDEARQELVLTPAPSAQRQRYLLFTVWAAPTEDANLHDAFLYEKYRAQITMGARAMLMAEAHAHGAYQTNRGLANARGDSLMYARADRLEAQFREATRRARTDVETAGQSSVPPPDMWAVRPTWGTRR